MVDTYEEILEKAKKRWQAKGFSEAKIKALLARKGEYKEPRKTNHVTANNDSTFNSRTRVDELQIELERKRSLKEVWDETPTSKTI